MNNIDETEKPLKIVFLGAGSNQFMEPYLNYFRARGHEVHFLVISQPITTKSKDCVIDISYGARGRKFSSKWKYLLAPFKLRKILKELKPDKTVPPKADSVFAEGRKSLLTVKRICPIHAEPVQRK